MARGTKAAAAAAAAEAPPAAAAPLRRSARNSAPAALPPVAAADEEDEAAEEADAEPEEAAELGWAGGAAFRASFKAALVAGGDDASDGEPAAAEPAAPPRGASRCAARAAAAAALGDAAAAAPGSGAGLMTRGRGRGPAKPSLLGDDAFVADPGSDSSEEDEGRAHNTVGDVPPQWYAAEGHIGYDADGKKLAKSAGRGDGIDAFLAGRDSSRAWRTLYDPVQDETYTLTAEEVALIQQLRSGVVPGGGDAYAPYLDVRWSPHANLVCRV